MAIYNGRILMRKGNEADFDPSKLMSGEWAVSLDAGIVRICLEAGKVIRMATYEAFEEDMKQIEAILLECQSIEEAVRRINTEVSEKLNACAEYVQQAKNYSEQAKTSEANSKSYMQSAKTSEENAKVSETNAKASENSAKEYENSAKLTEERAREVFESIPEDYSTISNDLYELAIKETASGEEIHVNDGSNLKLREFALYGKAKQNTTSGKNKLPITAISQTINGVSFTVNDIDKSIVANGTATADVYFVIGKCELDGSFILSGCPSGGGYSKYYLEVSEIGVANIGQDYGNCVAIQLSGKEYTTRIRIANGATLNNAIFYPMISLEGGEYEPFTNGASPNPQFPQEIEVPSGSVVVKSCGKNLLKNEAATTTINGITYTVKTDGSGEIIVNGTATDVSYMDIPIKLVKGIFYIVSGCPLSGSDDTYKAYALDVEVFSQMASDYGNGQSFTAKCTQYNYRVRVAKGYTANNLVFKPMIRLATDTDDTYQPYKETTSEIPVTDFAGIPVSSGGNYTDSNGQQWICDEIVKYADGSGKSIQRVEEKTLTKNDINSVTNSENGYYFTTFIKGKKEGYSLCNRFKGIAFSERVNNPNMYRCYLNGDGYLVIRNSTENKYTTVQELANFIEENETKVIYELATPIETPLTAEEIAEIEKLHTFYPVTNISNDFDCGMSVTYYCDSKNYIGNQLAIMKQEQEEVMMNMLLLMPTEVQAMMIENDTNELLKESEI